MGQTGLGALFKLFSIAFAPPTIAWTKVLSSGNLRQEMQAVWTKLELPNQPMEAFAEALVVYEGGDEEKMLHELRQETTRLFLGDKPRIANSEGMWRMKAEGRQAVLIVNSYSREVAAFMRQCGVVKAGNYQDCLDYIEVECDFASFLASSPEHLLQKGEDPLLLLDSFIDNHMKLWIPGFCAEVEAATSVIYYKTLCATMDEFLKEL